MPRLKVHAKPENLAHIAAFITDVAERWGLESKEVFEVQLAVDEACTNIIEHGYRGDEAGTIEISCRQAGDECTITIRDFGRRFDPDEVPEPDIDAPLEDRPVGGLGLFFMRQLMDSVDFRFDADRGNVLIMTKRREPVVVRGPAEAEAVRTVVPRGRLDADLAQELESVLEDLMANGLHQLMIDFRHTTYISSSGLRVLLVALREARAHNGDVVLFNMRPRVRKVFALSGFDQLFSIFDTEASAVQALPGISDANFTP